MSGVGSVVLQRSPAIGATVIKTFCASFEYLRRDRALAGEQGYDSAHLAMLLNSIATRCHGGRSETCLRTIAGLIAGGLKSKPGGCRIKHTQNYG
jgi:hypothetical protein